MGDEMEGAVQQAAQPGRQFMAFLLGRAGIVAAREGCSSNMETLFELW